MNSAAFARRPAPNRSISVADMFPIGIGPSSSHTMGPMRAACEFSAEAARAGARIARVECELFGSLALTGVGHGTDNAVLLGLSGHLPDTVDIDAAPGLVETILAEKRLMLAGRYFVPFDRDRDLLLNGATFLPGHPNALTFRAMRPGERAIEQTYFSVGGGEIRRAGTASSSDTSVEVALPFESGAELLEIGRRHNMTIAEIVRENERSRRSNEETDALVDNILQTMNAAIERGCIKRGVLPGGLKVRRRAPHLYSVLAGNDPSHARTSAMFNWVSLWALAVSEENAAHGRVVSAPTNGACGVIPAVIRYYETFIPNADREGARDFIYTASAIGQLYKRNASVSAAEMGCQGEVGVACSMAAAGLTAVLGGSNEQIENAAEIGMEHNLGLTCDPVGGLVQIPCIERNTMGAIKAINAAHLAMHGSGAQIVSLDAVIETMRQTGKDMGLAYKETSLAGLAANVPMC